MTYGVDIQIWYSTSSTLDYDAVEQILYEDIGSARVACSDHSWSNR